MNAAFGKPSQKEEEKLSFGHCPNWGGPPYRNLFGHFFKSEKVAQIGCRGEGVIWVMPKKRVFFSGKSSRSNPSLNLQGGLAVEPPG